MEQTQLRMIQAGYRCIIQIQLLLDNQFNKTWGGSVIMNHF